MTAIGTLHANLVFGRRVRVLSQAVAKLLPDHASVLDVGCGDGSLSSLVMAARPDVRIEGIDVLVRPQTHIPVQKFDGVVIPNADKSVDAVMFVDVLHHTDDPEVLVREAARVARKCIVIKDHCRDGFLAGPTLRFMDWVGNAHHGVVLPYNYLPESRWREIFSKHGLKIADWQSKLSLYPWWASWAFGRSLHFVARLDV